jgi:hypothetical protein
MTKYYLCCKYFNSLILLGDNYFLTKNLNSALSFNSKQSAEDKLDDINNQILFCLKTNTTLKNSLMADLFFNVLSLGDVIAEQNKINRTSDTH